MNIGVSVTENLLKKVVSVAEKKREIMLRCQRHVQEEYNEEIAHAKSKLHRYENTWWTSTKNIKRELKEYIWALTTESWNAVPPPGQYDKVIRELKSALGVGEKYRYPTNLYVIDVDTYNKCIKLLDEHEKDENYETGFGILIQLCHRTIDRLRPDVLKKENI